MTFRTPALLAALAVSHLASASSLDELARVKDGPALARFMHQKITAPVPARELSAGLQSKLKLQLKGYSTPIPAREVFGTIVEMRYEAQLPKEFWNRSFGYGVRETCAFRDAQDQVVRYSILIFDEPQYRSMKDLLAKLPSR